MTTRDQWVDHYLRKVRFGQFLHRSAEWLAAYLFTFGTAVLIVKLMIPQLWPHVLWMALGLLPAIGMAWLISRRDSFTRAESIVMLDRRLDAGGLFMTLNETPDSQWEAKLPQVEAMWQNSLPKIRPTRFGKYVCFPIVFAVGAGFAPLRDPLVPAVLANTVGREASQQLEEMLEELDAAEVLDEEEKKQLKEEIARLAEETKDTPLTHEKWETVDALREKMRLRVDTSAMTISKATDAVAALAKAGDADAALMSIERIDQLQKDVIETLRKLSKTTQFSGASSELRDQLQRLLKSGDFNLPEDAEARKKMLDDLQEYLDQEFDRLSELREKCKKCETCPGGT